MQRQENKTKKSRKKGQIYLRSTPQITITEPGGLYNRYEQIRQALGRWSVRLSRKRVERNLFERVVARIIGKLIG